MSGSVGQQPARLAADSIYPPANSEPTEYHSGTTTPRCGGRLRGLGASAGIGSATCGIIKRFCLRCGRLWSSSSAPVTAARPGCVQAGMSNTASGTGASAGASSAENTTAGRCRGCASPRGLPTPVLGTFPAIIDVSELFSGIESRPHILNAALHPRLIRLFENERAAVVGGYPRLGSCR